MNAFIIKYKGQYFQYFILKENSHQTSCTFEKYTKIVHALQWSNLQSSFNKFLKENFTKREKNTLIDMQQDKKSS